MKAGTKNLTPDTMTKIWRLYQNGVSTALICETLGTSIASVNRVIKVMETAKEGGDVDALDGNNHKKIKAFAKQFFGIKETAAEKPPKAKAAPSPTDDIGDMLFRLLGAVHEQNELLKKLCSAWGVEQGENK